jgi:hypothetical protein
MSNLGITWHYLGDDGLAEAEFLGAQRVDPNNPAAQKSLAALKEYLRQHPATRTSTKPATMQSTTPSANPSTNPSTKP